MVGYWESTLASLLTTLFFVFLIAAAGYLVGSIEIKGISLGTAGVLLAALAFGMIAARLGSFDLGGKAVVLFHPETVKPLYSFLSNIGTALFVTAVGYIAGPKFFRCFNKKSIGYIGMGAAVILIGVVMALIIKLTSGISSSLAAGLLSGALTSTPGLSAAKDAAMDPDAATAGYGIAYIFGVLGVVLFVQLMPKFAKLNIAEEQAHFRATAEIEEKKSVCKLRKVDDFDFFPFMMTAVLGMLIGTIKIPCINFSLGTSGGTLLAGLLSGHFGRAGKIDLSVSKSTLNVFRELGLMLFLIGAGVPGGVNFIKYAKLSYFLYGALMTLVPMLAGSLLGKYVFKMSVLNNLSSITGGMTSTPALGTLIHVAGTDEIAHAYAATYPVALVLVVLSTKLLVLL